MPKRFNNGFFYANILLIFLTFYIIYEGVLIMENLGYYNGKYDLIENMTVPMNDRVCWFGDGVYLSLIHILTQLPSPGDLPGGQLQNFARRAAFAAR